MEGRNFWIRPSCKVNLKIRHSWLKLYNTNWKKYNDQISILVQIKEHIINVQDNNLI